MKAQDYDEFVTVLNATASALGKASPTDVAIAVHWSVLAPYEIAQVRSAITRHLRDPDVGQFMPKPADIIRQLDGGSEDRAAAAWAKVEFAVTRVGPWKPVAFDDATIHAVIDQMGGMAPLMRAKHEEWNILRSWFIKAYRAQAGKPTAYSPMLFSDGGKESELVLIGDADKARQVMAGSQGRVLASPAPKLAAG